MSNNAMLITSLQNPRVKYMVALRDRRERDRSQLMRVEGFEELSLALASGARPTTLFFCPALFRDPQQARMIDQAAQLGTELIEVTPPVFEKMSYRDGPDGWLATLPLLNTTLAALPVASNPLVVVAESVEKPGNLGAMLRTADAAGVNALIAAAPQTDWGNPNIVRSSKGALFSVPVAAGDNHQTLEWLRAHSIQIVAATPQASRLYTETDMRGPVAIAVGEEKYGLSEFWLREADIQVRIPMFGRVDSLNVATATALLVYEVVRQRAMS